MKILHLYHDLMNLYGDYGNVCAVEKTACDKGKSVEIIKQSLSDEPDFSCNLLYIGSGTEKNQKAAMSHLIKYRDIIKQRLDEGLVILTTGNAFEMFGKSVTDKYSQRHEGLSLFDFESVESDERIVTDCLFKTELCDVDIIGFINKASVIKGVTSPLFEVVNGCGNDKDDTGEGIIKGGFIGTHLIGPLLIRNSLLCERLIDMIK